MENSTEYTYVLCTSKSEHSTYNYFPYPKLGSVEHPNWSAEPKTGNGLHGLLLGCGHACLVDWSEGAQWVLVKVLKIDIVELCGQVKFPRGDVIFSSQNRVETIKELERLSPQCLTLPVQGSPRGVPIFLNGTHIAGRPVK